ncbi:hypothetical protein TEA_002497 [Camellia sinensis var. sinensis]|uniref:HVA22-like protein n=1 Tax=Camellia sinensis var. sinensis TaxID=542762 RepID=A0A4S4F344_CAMSN|nr:hypothetical protein TEA_002497 [Camellia sinensis var. sinensis]
MLKELGSEKGKEITLHGGGGNKKKRYVMVEKHPKKKGYIQLNCDITPRAYENFITLYKRGYYNVVAFHINIILFRRRLLFWSRTLLRDKESLDLMKIWPFPINVAEIWPFSNNGDESSLLAFLYLIVSPNFVKFPFIEPYASVMAIESPSKVDDEQWLAYWILYSFLTLVEMLLQPILQWIPIWYDIKLAFVAWLVLPQFRGAAVIYERFVREKLRKYGAIDPHKSPNGNRKGKNKFVDFITPKKVS